MRHVYACLVLCALLAHAGLGRSAGTPGQASRPTLTIVLQFRGPHAVRPVEDMEQEVENILRESGWSIAWVSWKQVSQGVFDELAVVRMNGDCEVSPWMRLPPAEGPLGVAHVSDGVVLPFSDIACDKIASSVQPAIWGLDPAQADLVFGRAVGRVVAHELVHMISRSTAHGRRGVAQPGLSESDLTCRRLDLSAKDLLRISGQDRR
jgi:hypothetical protein